MSADDPRRRPFPTVPPEAGRTAVRVARAIGGPIETFMHVEAAGGIILLVAAAAALVWANSGWHESYEHLWHTMVGLRIGGWGFERDLHFWINEGLMTVFFLVVGLEIKREMVEGALADWQRASLPIVAAIGGMLVPAGIYFAINPSGPTSDGWGVPMATDIAFAVGVLTLLGRRVPAALRILLLALAIIDDIGAILVIAVFYSAGIGLEGMATAAAGVLLLVLLHRMGVRPGWSYAIPLGITWAGLYQAGVHPTIGGVVVGLLTPVRRWVGAEGFVAVAERAVEDLRARVGRGAPDRELLGPLNDVAFARREAIAPAIRLERALHGWVAFGIMPLFALANAGVRLAGIELGGTGFWPVLGGVGLGLVVGKPLGVVLTSWAAVRVGLCALPAGLTWAGVFVMGAVAGIGFTMAIFIAELAFSDPMLLGVAKLGVLGATALAAVIGLVTGRVLLREPESARPAAAESAVEKSTDLWLTGRDLDGDPET
jgi:NhaA family Na+:H+ antiporter